LKENVERVLNIATIEKENFELVPVSIEINDLIKKVISNFEFRLNNYNAQINFEGLAGEFFMTADETHLTNVFHNLIDNALKYGKENTIINISLKLLSNKLFISIRDNGIGIGKEEQKKIFDKFYRVQNGNLHNVKGFGLGLSYVKSIIAEHKWTIEVKSELGKGTCFEIYLPINFSK
jgi:two-component system phosphate regulon sensor histidine kinase PhoR